MFLVPAVGVPSDLVVQDTLKSAIAALGILFAAFTYLWNQQRSPERLLWHGLVGLPLVLMLYALGSMLWSHAYLAGVEAIRWFLVALLMWLGINTFKADQLPRLMHGIHWGAAVASVWVALQFWFDLQLFPQAAAPSSTFINRNFFSEYVVCALPFSVWLLVSQKSTRWQIACATSISLMVVALLMTGTRSALLALILVVPALLFIVWRYRHLLAFGEWQHAQMLTVIAILFFGTLGMAALPSGNTQINKESGGVTTPLQRSYQRAASAAKPDEYVTGSFSLRIVLWRATARLMMDRALTGVGAGAWEVEIPLYETPNTRFETDYYAHNEYLQFLSEYGLVVGGISMAFMLAYWLFYVGSTLRQPLPGEVQSPPRAFALASILSLFVVSGAGFPLHLAGCTALLPICLALVAREDALKTEIMLPHHYRWTSTAKIMGIATLGLCLMLAAFISAQAFRAEYHIVQALKLSAKLSKGADLDVNARAEMKFDLLHHLRTGIDINPHYRRLSALAAEPLSAQGDWHNAIWVLESVAGSRPHIAAIWEGLALAHSALGEHDAALHAVNEVKRLRPGTFETVGLEVRVLSQAGRDQQATELLEKHFNAGTFDVPMTEMGYAIGYKTRNWPLAIRSLELRNQMWPAQAADGHMRLGKIYMEPEINDRTRALNAFREGRNAVPADQKENYREQVPEMFRDAM